MSLSLDEQPVSEAYMAAVDLALALGFREIGNLPGAWVHRVDEHWTVAINGKPQPVEVEPEGCMLVTLEPFHMAAWANWLLAALITPYDGCVVGIGGCSANEDNLIAALEAARRAA